MQTQTCLESVPAYGAEQHIIYLFSTQEAAALLGFLTEEEYLLLQEGLALGLDFLHLRRPKQHIFLRSLPKEEQSQAKKEALRCCAAEDLDLYKKYKLQSIGIEQRGASEYLREYIEGLALANYQFLRHKTKNLQAQKSSFASILLRNDVLEAEKLYALQIEIDAACWMRDMVNQPLSHLTALDFAEEFGKLSQAAGFDINVLHKEEIEKLGMGGLLIVNKGSVQPPTFSIMEWKPATALNSQPIVLVGKGLVYDTGGMSLKPTANSMDFMKCDMTGGALVGALMYLVAKKELPLHIVGLVPATDNRPAGDAYVPGDVYTSMSGLTVEVLNTDAEGRLVLADALHFAKQYKPDLVFDFATLTGAAAVALGTQGAVYMGTANANTKQGLETAGLDVHERLMEMPLWKEYAEMLKSDIADLKNMGGAKAGAITAGMFLKHFTDYPWLHFDIAGVAFLHAAEKYRTKGGTSFGLRLIGRFLEDYAAQKQTPKT